MTAVETATRHTLALSKFAGSSQDVPISAATWAHQIGHHVLPHRAARPGMTELAELSARLPGRTGDAIGILLAAARPFDDGFQTLRPFWAQEAAHRALTMLRLFAALQHSNCGRGSWRGSQERRLALHLAAELASLETTDITRVLPCSGPLRETTRDLVALFASATGQVVLDTDVTPLSLPAYKRRALVLLGNELVANALTHAFKGRALGRISLRLWRFSSSQACLEVCDDGVGYASGRPDPAANTAGALSDLLEGEIRYFTPMSWGAMAELKFPIS